MTLLTTDAVFDLLVDFASDPRHGWSIGSFAAIGEFIRDADEPATIRHLPDRYEVATSRGAMRIVKNAELHPAAWDGLSGDGESWSHHLAFCCAQSVTQEPVIRHIGEDVDAIRAEDKQSALFDLGVSCGAVAMCLRAHDANMLRALQEAEGQPFVGNAAVMQQLLISQPHRVMTSPAGRIEIYQHVPPPDGKSPEGPHTHLLFNLVEKNRPHSANTPIPLGMQSALTLHPRSPWRNALGEKHDFRADIDAEFAPWLARFGLGEDQATDANIRAIIAADAAPDPALWPKTRRARTKARIVLRRLAAAGDGRAAPWRVQFDRAEDPIDEGETV